MKYTISKNSNLTGTRLQGYIHASYSELVEKFGEPMEGDSFKVSTKWILKSEEEEIVTIYDWKSTFLYDEDLPSVQEFRKLPEYVWHVGAFTEEVSNRFIKYFNALK